jgi:hypothetical protein
MAAVELELNQTAAVNNSLAEFRTESLDAMIHKLSDSFIKPVNEPDAIPRCVQSLWGGREIWWVVRGTSLRAVREKSCSAAGCILYVEIPRGKLRDREMMSPYAAAPSVRGWRAH